MEKTLIEAPKRRPRVFYGWYIVWASVGVNFYLSTAFWQGFQVFFLPILREFEWSRAMTSGAFSLRQLESGLLAPLVGFLVDRWGPRTVILMSVVIVGAGMVMMSTISSPWMFYLAFMIVSLGAGGASHGISWPVAIANWFRRLRGRALGIAMLGPVVGGPFVIAIAFLEELMGWRSAMLALGVGMWVIGIPLAMVVRSRPEPYGYLPDGELVEQKGRSGTVMEASAPEEASSGLTTREALRTRDFWIFSLLLGAVFSGISGLSVHLIPLLQDIDYSAAQAAGVLGLVFMLSGIGRVGVGVLADLADQRLILVGLIACQVVALLILVGVGPSAYWQVGIFALLLGTGFGGMLPFRPFLIMRLFGPRAFGTIQGLVQGVSVAIGMLGPVFYGRVYDVRGSYDLAIYVSMAIAALGIPLVFLLRNPRQAAQGQAYY